MGFRREKTIYVYFALIASGSLPLDSIARLIVTNTRIIVTVVDNFYDVKGSLSELEVSTNTIKRYFRVLITDFAMWTIERTIFLIP